MSHLLETVNPVRLLFGLAVTSLVAASCSPAADPPNTSKGGATGVGQGGGTGLGGNNTGLGGNTMLGQGGSGVFPQGGGTVVGQGGGTVVGQGGGTVVGQGGGTVVGQGGGTVVGQGGGTVVGQGGGTGGGVEPPGYWKTGAWHGCAWTGVGKDGTSTIMPQDFVSKAAADAYCVSGTVGAEPMYKSVALLGFNVNEPTSASCAYKPVDVNAAGPPSVKPMKTGIALNFVKKGTDTTFTLRVQIQGPNGHKEGTVGENDRWCATITEVQGSVFVPYTSFTPKCWETEAGKRGTPYANQEIAAVVFTVPGKLTDTPYNFCVNGFADGASVDDAPMGPATGGDQKGTVGGPGARDLDFARAKVNVGGENYIIQNNNWGNPEGTDLQLSYTNNSFKITSGSGTGASAPASFPSIYIGNNGNTANGVYSTSTTDNLPLAINSIKDLFSTFRYSGSTNSFNATYDIWFSDGPPPAGYKDGVSGFIMVWLRDPSGKQPIGSMVGTSTIAGQTWNVWKGPRGDGPNGYNNAPVVSYLNPTENDNSRAQSFKNVNLKDFFTDAVSKYQFPGNLLLTDVFAGFEIWDGGAGGNLAVDEFTAVVNKN